MEAEINQALIHELERYERRLNRDLRVLYALIRRLNNRIRSQIMDAIGGSESLSWYQVARVRDIVERAGEDFDHHLAGWFGGALATAWNAGATVQPRALRRLRLPYPTLDIPSTRLTLAQQVGQVVSRTVSQQFTAQANLIVTRGVAGNATIGQINRSLNRAISTNAPITSRTERTFRTELMAAFSTANEVYQQEAAAQIPEVRKRWVGILDNRIRPAHFSAHFRYEPGGAVGPIPVAQRYIVGGERCVGPHDPNLSPDNRVNCRCISVLVLPPGAADAVSP